MRQTCTRIQRRRILWKARAARKLGKLVESSAGPPLRSIVTKRNSGSELHVSARPSPDQVRGQVDKILASRLFARSERLCRFLRFCVELTLDEKSDQLKEQLVGVEVFDRKGDYDPRTDPIVRVEARRLRSKLKAYYTSSGRPDCLLIELPKGGYVPSFRMRNASQPRSRRAAAARRQTRPGNDPLPFFRSPTSLRRRAPITSATVLQKS